MNDAEYKFFDKIRKSDLLTTIFAFLNLSNVKVLLYVCSRFRRHLFKEDSKQLRIIGYYTYGLDKQKPFECNPNSQIEVTAIKANNHPIKNFATMDDLGLIAMSAGTFEYGLIIWGQESGVYQYEIDYRDKYGRRTFVEYMIYQYGLNTLSVAYSDGSVVVYEFDAEVNSKEQRYHILWKKLVGLTNPVKKLAYVSSTSQLLTLEDNSDLALNFIKIWDHRTGNHVKSAVISNNVITCFQVFEMPLIPISFYGDDSPRHEETRYENYLVMSINDRKNQERVDFFLNEIQDTQLALKRLDKFEQNFIEACPEVFLYGHTSSVTDLMYIKEKNYLLSCSVDLYIFVWNMKTKNIIKIIDSEHEDIIYSMAYINSDKFATCGKDRNIFIWSLSEEDTNPVIQISDHTSDVFDIKFNELTQELLSISFDQSLRGFKFSKDFKKVTEKRRLTGHISNISSAQFDFINQLLITVGLDHLMCFWDMNTISLKRTIELPVKEYFDDFIRLSDDNNTIVKIDNSKTIKLFDEQKAYFYQAINETSMVRSILNLYDGVSFIVGLSNSEISVYNYISDQERRIFKKKKTLLHADDNEANPPKNLKIKKLVYLDSNLKIIASCASNGSICVFYLNSENKKVYIPPLIDRSEITDICGVKFTKESEIIALSVEEEFYLYDIKNKTMKTFLLGRVGCIDKLNSTYLTFFLSTSKEATIAIFDVEEEKIVKTIQVSGRNVKPLFYMRDGKRILSGGGSPDYGYSIDIISFSS